MSQERALQLVSEFASNERHPAFKKLDRRTVADELVARIKNPALINQAVTGTCGPASIIYNLARTDPFSYAIVATGLFDYGVATLRRWQLKPCADVLASAAPPGMPQADWLVLASIRDSENWFFDFTSQKDKWGDSSVDGELVKWLKAAGYRDVQVNNDDYYVGARGKKAKQLMDSIALWNKDYSVIWIIDSAIINSGVNKSPRADHYVSMAGPCYMPPNEDAPVSFPIFTWGRSTKIPETGGLKFGQFLDGYFGYIAAKY